MDIFWPDAGRGAPLALFVHGGYWQATDRSLYSHLAAGLLGNGVAVALPSYDLCPDVTLAEIGAQLRQAAAFLHTRLARPMLAIGHSAGGHLAACLLAAGLAPAALSLSGLFDLAPLTRTSINAALRLDAAEAARLSPALWPRPAGRIHAVVGGAEGTEYERQSRTIAEAWGGTWESVAGEDHFSLIAPLAETASDLTQHAARLIRHGII